MNRMIMLAAFVLVAATPTVSAQIVYTDNFDAGTSGGFWTTSISPMTAVGGADANFAFDYSTVGIPSAPNSMGGTTIGTRLRINQAPTGIFSGISVSPNGQSFTGDYTLRFDLWQNFNGPFPGGGSGSTQASGGGIGALTGTAQFPSTAINGLYVAATGDGGSANDYRAYVNTGSPLADTSGVYAAGNTLGVTNSSNAYYSTNNFGSLAAPAAQQALFAQQSGSTAAGTAGMAWRTWTIAKSGNIVTWSMTNNSGADILMATVDVTLEAFAGDNIFLGLFDINATSSTDPNAPSLLFALFDNVQVTAVPEPGSLALVGIAGGILAVRRRRNQTKQGEAKA